VNKNKIIIDLFLNLVAYQYHGMGISLSGAKADDLGAPL